MPTRPLFFPSKHKHISCQSCMLLVWQHIDFFVVFSTMGGQFRRRLRGLRACRDSHRYVNFMIQMLCYNLWDGFSLLLVCPSFRAREFVVTRRQGVREKTLISSHLGNTELEVRWTSIEVQVFQVRCINRVRDNNVRSRQLQEQNGGPRKLFWFTSNAV